MSNGLPALKITDVKTIMTAPDGIRLVIVKVETSEPGLYGIGCATFTQRPLAVATAVDEYLRPFLIGKDPDRIEDIFQSSFVSSYWRNGPVLNNAMSGVDMALWDIKGKRANMPVYQLLGGKCRHAVALYGHAGGGTFEQVGDSIESFMDQGYRYVRAQVGIPGYSTYGSGGGKPIGRVWKPIEPNQETFEPTPYVNAVIKMFEYLRIRLGDDIELLHDVHERIPPIQAITLAKELEKFRLFFLEDVFAPEDIEYLRILRQQTSTPIAISELFNNAIEFVPMIKDRLFDFIRVHISQIGGISPARKLAAFCEFFNIRTAWHGPGDVSPVGHAANMALDLSCYNFGIQEQTVFGQRTHEVFPGCPEIRDGYMWSNDLPGLGIDVNEELAKKYPFPEHPLNGAWGPIRRLDGTVIRP
jgi:mannonate dehydratase